MKNLTKRILSLTMVLILILSVTAVFSGCYVVRSGKMRQIEGTYQLTIYSGNSDYLTERGMTLYMVLKGDGTGYYAYSSNDTEPHIAELRCRFLNDPDESGKFDYVEIDFDGRGEYVKFAVNASWNSTNLNSQRAVWKGSLLDGTLGIDYYIHSDFSRVDNATDLSYINEKFGTYDVLPFGALRFNGMYELEEIEYRGDGDTLPENPYVYAYFTVDVINKSIKAWFMTKDEEKHLEDTDSFEMVSENGSLYFKVNNVNLYADASYGPYSYCIRIKYDDNITLKFGARGTWEDEYLQQQIDARYKSYMNSKTHSLIEEGIRGLMTDGELDVTKYTPEKFEEIDSLIATYLGYYKATENTIDTSLLYSYKKARLHYLYEAALANVEAAYEASTDPMKEGIKSALLTRINNAYIKSYSFSAMVVCKGDHAEGVECDCTEYVLVEDVASEGLKVFTAEYCNNSFNVTEPTE